MVEHLDAVPPTVVDSLVRIWSALHVDLDIVVPDVERSGLRRLLIEMDDDLVAGLFAAKLSLARPVDPHHPSPDLARVGSEVGFMLDGREMSAVLTRGTTADARRLGIASRFGAALLSLRAGQTLLWPDERWRLVELRLLEVTPPRRSWWRNLSLHRHPESRSCASG